MKQFLRRNNKLAIDYDEIKMEYIFDKDEL